METAWKTPADPAAILVGEFMESQNGKVCNMGRMTDEGAAASVSTDDSSATGVRVENDGVTCKTCLAPVLPPQKVYCSSECKTRFRNSRVRRTPATCVMCGVPFMARLQSVREGAGQCCSSRCAAAYVKATGLIAGERSPHWIDGRSLPVKNRYPEKFAARYAVKVAIRNGVLVRQPCERCGTTVRVHAHHDDYSKPLDVRWLCATHHVHVHMELRGVDVSKRPPRRERMEPEKWTIKFRENLEELRSSGMTTRRRKPTP